MRVLSALTRWLLRWLKVTLLTSVLTLLGWLALAALFSGGEWPQFFRSLATWAEVAMWVALVTGLWATLGGALAENTDTASYASAVDGFEADDRQRAVECNPATGLPMDGRSGVDVGGSPRGFSMHHD